MSVRRIDAGALPGRVLRPAAGCVLLSGWLVLASVVRAEPAEQGEPVGQEVEQALAPPVQAIWKPQEIKFWFQSFTTFYSCGALERKIERVLHHLGVRAQVDVRSVECLSGVARMPRVTILASSPVEATPEALAEREKSRSTLELIARVRGKRGEEAVAFEQFPAQWQRVSLSKGALDLEPGDCELIEQLHRKVLPKLAVRVVQDDLHCTPHQLTLGQPRLEVEALLELPEPDQRHEGRGSRPQPAQRGG
jgi:hypothetical protein